MSKISLTCVLSAALVACSRPSAPATPASGLTTGQFISIYVALRQAQSTAHTPEEFERAKQRVFQKAGATPQNLQQFVQEHAADVTMMANVWDTISNRLARAGGDHSL